MKTESNQKPEKITFESKDDNKCDVIFTDNVEEITTEEETKYIYDMYRITVNSRANLEKQIEESYDKWLELAKETEYNNLAKEIRTTRDKFLEETDWTQVTDTALTEEKQAEYKEYRQKLRDITAQEGFPYYVEYPKKP